MTAVVTFRGARSFLPTVEMLTIACAKYPHMEIYRQGGREIFEVHDSDGSVLMAKCVCLFVDTPDNPVFTTGSFKDHGEMVDG
jgi:hypothetical protein